MAALPTSLDALARVEKKALENCKDDEVYKIFQEKVAGSSTVLVLDSLKVEGTERIAHLSQSLTQEIAQTKVSVSQSGTMP